VDPRDAECGDGAAADELFNTLYSGIHRMAKRELARRGSPATLSVTTLLHEPYLDIAERESNCAKPKRDPTRGEFEITSLETDPAENPVDVKELSSIRDALDQLAKVEPNLAELVDMKFFCGFCFAEIAALENLSERTVQ
jgi:DNA-directed RNA polymerase specialized sigma24 family protein